MKERKTMVSKAPKNWDGQADTLPADAFENYIKEQALVIKVAALGSRAKPGDIDDAWLAVDRVLNAEGENSIGECVAICLARTLALRECYHTDESIRVMTRLQKVLKRLGIRKPRAKPQDYPAQSR